MYKRRIGLVVGVLASVALAPTASAQDGGLAPPTNVRAEDYPWDDAGEVILKWDASTDPNVTDYFIYSAVGQVGDFVLSDPKFTFMDVVPASTVEAELAVNPNIGLGDARTNHGDQLDIEALAASGTRFKVGYLFEVEAVDSVNVTRSARVRTATPIVATMQIFSKSRLGLAIVALIFCGAVIYWINHARAGKPIKVRKIAGLEAIDEAVGRATEMGRSCLFVPGIQDINEIQTIAGLTILSHVSKTAAEYDAKVEVPTSRSLVMTTARETVQAAFLAAGRPDAYNEDLIYYVTDEQFGYVAYLQGMMVREKPAACFYLGAFFAESLILAETGNSIEAIQIAGTAMPAQLPFFVAACDYTLIGEEFFAASAYLSGSPEELGSLKGQDVGKVIVAVLLVVGVLLATLAEMTGSESIAGVLDFIKSSMLT